METFLEYETMYHETPLGHVFVGSSAEIDPKKAAEVMHLTRDKKTMPLRPTFSCSLRNPWSHFAGNVQGLVFSGLNPTCQVSSKLIQVSEIY